MDSSGDMKWSQSVQHDLVLQHTTVPGPSQLSPPSRPPRQINSYIKLVTQVMSDVLHPLSHCYIYIYLVAVLFLHQVDTLPSIHWGKLRSGFYRSQQVYCFNTYVKIDLSQYHLCEQIDNCVLM